MSSAYDTALAAAQAAQARTEAAEMPAGAGTERRRVWRCARCGETLAVLIGRMIVYPDGDTANLPARITCPRCKRRNVKIE